MFPAVPSTTVPPGFNLHIQLELTLARIHNEIINVQSPLLSILDDSEGSSVFDTTTRVLKLGLSDDVASRLCRQLPQANLCPLSVLCNYRMILFD